MFARRSLLAAALVLGGLMLATNLHATAIAGLNPLPVSPSRMGPGNGPPVLPDSGALFGAFVSLGGGSEADSHLEFEALVGRKLAIDKQSYSWDEEFPADYETWSRDQGRTLFFSWNTRMSDDRVVPWADIAAGEYDADIDAIAGNIKAFGTPALFQFAHEPETLTGIAGSPQDFIDAYRRVHGRFAAKGVTNLSHVLTLMASTYLQGGADDYYPGENYVDLLGADGYNWYACPDRPDSWRSFAEVFQDFYDYGLSKGKPMAISEWGSHEDPDVPDRKAQWITDAAETLKSWPEIKLVSYFNEASGCDWWVDSSQSSLEAFSAMGADPYFNPPPPLVTITSSPPDPNPSTSATFAFEANVRNSTFTCSLDGGSGVACTSGYTFRSLSQGGHTATITATDPISGLAGSTIHTWTVDTVRPILTVMSGPPEYTEETTATFNLESSEAPGIFTCQLDGGSAEECDARVEYVGLTEGAHTFTATATDEAGNVSQPVIWPWTVDATLPTITITSGPASLTNSKSATFTFSSNEPAATFKCSRDGLSYGVCSSPHTYSWLSDGLHTFSAVAKDPAGNESAEATWAWTIDATKPTVTILSSPSNPSKLTTATFTFTSSEAGSTFTCQLDSNPAASCVSGVTYAGLSQGQHTVTISGTDPAGNVGTAKYNWKVDSILPVVTISSGPSDISSSSTATFKFFSNEGSNTFSCKLDAGAAVSCTSPKTYSGLSNGSHTFTVTATDAAGNVSLPATRTWTVDTVRPVASIVSGPPSLSNSKSATFDLSSNEPGSTFKCSIDGQSYLTCVDPRTYWLGEGAHAFSVKAVDLAKNESTPVSWTWTIDATKPTTTITSGPSDPTPSDTATFRFTADEAGVVFTCSLDGAPGTPCVTGVTYNGIAVGSHTFTVYGTDPAGNIGRTATWRWTRSG